jgi:hypothetical protein
MNPMRASTSPRAHAYPNYRRCSVVIVSSTRLHMLSRFLHLVS